ncbi:MAG TPA: DUF4058 family protein [Chloroflexota bacterium]|nr:DUF4058 family protein [Chloroflexota bacterium]
MPSPFPGMDPYLESAEWSSVHHSLTGAIGRQLAPKLSPDYVVRTEERFVMEMLDEGGFTSVDIYPDVGISETRTAYRVLPYPETETGGPVELRMAWPTAVPHVALRIISVANRKLVTSIEVISPTNKRGAGYGQYLEKRHRILTSDVHLVEIDLLRKGKRIPLAESLPDAPYFVFLSRAEKRPLLDIWPVQINQPLPHVTIPLLPGDDDVLLDLQQALDTVYDEFRYDLSVDYTRPPEIPLDRETAVWAEQLLEKAGFQTAVP